MLVVGFEPTRANTVDLKSTPLDQLGHTSVPKLSNILVLETGGYYLYRNHPTS